MNVQSFEDFLTESDEFNIDKELLIVLGELKSLTAKLFELRKAYIKTNINSLSDVIRIKDESVSINRQILMKESEFQRLVKDREKNRSQRINLI